jgi:hypothetical protein
LQEVLDNVTVPATASQFSIVDDDENQVPVQVWLPNTTVTIETPADNTTNFEVIAEDGKTMILYSLVVDEGDPYITSMVYDIMQDRKIIDRYDGGSVAGFLSKLIPSEGATITVKDKFGYVKNDFDYVSIDDEIIVSNATGSVTYTLNAYGEYIMSNNSNLSTLTSSAGTLSPAFDSKVLNYTLALPSGSTSVTLTATVENETATVTGDGAITVTEGTTDVNIVVTAEDGTTTTYVVSIMVPTGIADFASGSILIYPNPVVSEYNIKLGDYHSDVMVKMTNLLGEVVLLRTESSSNIRVSMEGLASGLYFVTVSKGDNSVTRKIVKQ